MSGPAGVTDSPADQSSTTSAVPDGVLKPGALPSDTAVRFALLMLTVATASLYLFQALWFVLRGRLFEDDAARRCGTALADLVDGLSPTAAADLQRMTACRANVSLEQAGFAVLGSLVILVTAWAVYRVLPELRERRRHLEPPDPDDSQALLDEVTALSAEAGLARPPAVRLDAANPGVQAYVYGAGNHLRLAMTGGLVVQQVLDPRAFRAVLRHELAHVANRDVPWTYYTVAVWWSFVALALLPIAAVFVFTDPKYVLQLGWRTALLALLVALVAAAVLRAREAYADARSVVAGPTADLDRVLAAQPVAAGRRPPQLRVHPTVQERRLLLTDSDRLFHADWFTALAAGVAGGTAVASLQSIAYLSLPSIATVLAVFLVAPLLAGVLCVTAWRVGLREAVRGRRRSLGRPLGVGLAGGLAIAPLLTFDAARGGVASGPAGWWGYLIWAVAMSVVAVLIVQWVADSARLRVASLLAFERPHRALVAHIALATVVLAAFLTCSFYARLLLTSLGPQVLAESAPWLALPAISFGRWVPVAPLLVSAAVVTVPWLARHDLGKAATAPAAWPWSVQPSRSPDAIDALRATRPPFTRIVAMGLVAGGTAALALLAARLLLPAVSAELRMTDGVVHDIVVAAILVASAATALLLPARWWPLALVAGAVAAVVAGVAAILVQAPGAELVQAALAEPAIRAAAPAFLLAACVGALRSYRSRVHPTAHTGVERRVPGRVLVAGIATTLAVGIVAGFAGVGMLGAETTRVSGPEYDIVVPARWNGRLDSRTGETIVETPEGDVRVVIRPIEVPARPATGDWVNVGGRQAFLVGNQQQGEVRVLAYDVRGPDDVYRIVIVGSPASLVQREAELVRLFAAVSWVAD